MLSLFLGISIGILIGWNLPQPQYAKNLQEKIIAKFKDEL